MAVKTNLDIADLKKTMKNILKNIPKDSVFLYFGDSSNKKTRCRYAFQLVSEMRPRYTWYK